MPSKCVETKSQLLYSGWFLLNCSVKPLRVLSLIFAFRSFSFLFWRVWSFRPLQLSPPSFSIYARVPADIFWCCSKVHLSPCRSFSVQSMVQLGPCLFWNWNKVRSGPWNSSLLDFCLFMHLLLQFYPFIIISSLIQFPAKCSTKLMKASWKMSY